MTATAPSRKARWAPLHASVGAILEEQALAHDVIAAANRIHDAAMVGSRIAVLTEAGRLATKAIAARDELRRLAREVEK